MITINNHLALLCILISYEVRKGFMPSGDFDIKALSKELFDKYSENEAKV